MTASRDNQLVLATRSRLAEVTLLVGFCALAATSIAAHVLTRLGLFDAWAVIAIAVIASAAAAPFVRPAADRHETSDNSVARMALAIAAIAALSVAIFPSQELHGARDEGLYTIIAAVIAERGSVDMHNQAMALARSHFGPLISWNYPGIYSAVRYGLDGDFAEMIAQFNHLTPAVRAIAVDLFGIEHIWVSSAVIAGAAAAALVMCAGQITGAGWAGLAGLALVANAAFIYVSRSTFAETYTIAMILFAIVFGTRLLASGRTVFGVLAGLAAGLAMLSRVDGVLVAVPVAALAWACALDGRAGARSGLTWMLAIASAFLAVSWIDLHTFSQPYARDLVRVGYETSLVMAAGLLAMAWLGAAAAQPLATRPALAARLWTLARWGLILTVAATCLIFVQRYGASWFSDLEAAAEARKRLWGRYTRERMARELTWYVPLPLVLAALAGAWALARGAAPMRHAALVALGCAGLVIVATNIKIAPDHPWLSRRLLVLAVPYLLILAAVWLAAVHQSSRRFGTVAALIGMVLCGIAAWQMAGAWALRPLKAERPSHYAALAGHLRAIDSPYFITPTPEIASVLTYVYGVPTLRTRFSPSAFARDDGPWLTAVALPDAMCATAAAVKFGYHARGLELAIGPPADVQAACLRPVIYGVTMDPHAADAVDAPVATGTRIRFSTATAAAARHLGAGWSWIEDRGVWSTEETARLSVVVRESGEGATETGSDPLDGGGLRLYLRGRAHLPPGTDAQRIAVEVNGVAVGEVALSLAQITSPLTFDIPASAIGGDGRLDIRLTLPDAVSPAQAGTGTDRRTLALGLSEIWFSQIE